MQRPSGEQQGSGNTGLTSATPVNETPQPVTTGQPLAMSESGKWPDLFNTGNQDRTKFQADTVYFEFDRATVKSSEESKLQDVASYFKGNAADALIVEGNCDERGTEKYNLSLGERRALAVREYLANLGVDPQRIKTVTYGASRPADPGHDEAAFAKNRRAELVLVTPK
jgi:peptidoglycan-associated lipoprotein